jgi:hypothetical protein
MDFINFRIDERRLEQIRVGRLKGDMDDYKNNPLTNKCISVKTLDLNLKPSFEEWQRYIKRERQLVDVTLNSDIENLLSLNRVKGFTEPKVVQRMSKEARERLREFSFYQLV